MLKIEDFRKSEQAHGRAPGDVVGEWLQGEDTTTTLAATRKHRHG